MRIFGSFISGTRVESCTCLAVSYLAHVLRVAGRGHTLFLTKFQWTHYMLSFVVLCLAQALRRVSQRKSLSDKISVRKLCVLFRFIFGICDESRGSRRQSISDKVSVRKLCACFVISCLAHVVRFARHWRTSTRYQVSETEVYLFFAISCLAYVVRVAGRGDNIFLTEYQWGNAVGFLLVSCLAYRLIFESWRKHIFDKVSDAKWYVFCRFMFGIWNEIRPPSEQIYFWQSFRRKIISVSCCFVFGICGKSRRSLRKQISDKVSVRNWWLYFVAPLLAYVVRVRFVYHF